MRRPGPADKLLHEKLRVPAGYSLKWSGEYEFELRAKEPGHDMDADGFERAATTPEGKVCQAWERRERAKQ